ncbi:MAG: efflux RND transporter periplasmic adaptor subunit [Pandoraea sp.]|uniref:efflux RND transporter periplasmic adaptor subunit n=1 Tax=Pandoraea sp. TaxID=1883445 RepID=UPI0011FFCC0F|nr:efflux RND transporter periplasmic adaptor subunit [Pandoraea sp.]TAM18726.1 MAG: efflux RND transporter periplasmic adaptor subunit [Pandoraea sp.]
MKFRLILLSLVSLALTAGAGWYIINQSFDDSGASTANAAQSSPPPVVQTVNGEPVVVVSADAQRASHIEVAPLAAVTSQSAISADATVIDLQPLFDLRNRLASARADVDTFTAQAASSRTQYQGSRTLYADDRNVSLKSLQAAQSAMQGDDAKLQSARVTLAGLDGAMRQQFGDALANAAAAPGSKLFQRLQSGQAVVLRVTLPASFGMAPPERIAVDTPDDRTVPAQRLSASPLADPAVQGAPWLYVADAALPANLRTSARVPTSSQAVSGLLIPEQAVVWYGGQTWAYVRTAHDRFTRRYVAAGSEGDHGFMVTSGFHAGDPIVTQGAQLLLSEELKPQGIATACKDPPECDD